MPSSLSDDAGQFDVGRHALCWVHAERLVHRLDTFTDAQRAAQQHLRALIWWFYADLKAYRADPSARRRSELRARFDRIFRRSTGFVMLDRLLGGCLRVSPTCCGCSTGQRSRSTPMARRTTSAARSPSARSAAAPTATPAATAATPSSAWPDLRQARRQLLGLSRAPAQRRRRRHRPRPAGPRQAARRRLTARGFAPVT